MLKSFFLLFGTTRQYAFHHTLKRCSYVPWIGENVKPDDLSSQNAMFSAAPNGVPTVMSALRNTPSAVFAAHPRRISLNPRRNPAVNARRNLADR
jgi:hypothetical protein